MVCVFDSLVVLIYAAKHVLTSQPLCVLYSVCDQASAIAGKLPHQRAHPGVFGFQRIQVHILCVTSGYVHSIETIAKLAGSDACAFALQKCTQWD